MNSIIIVCIATLCGCIMGICAGKILKKNIYKNIFNSAEIQDDSGSSYEIFNNAGVTREFRQFEIKSAEVFSKEFVSKLAEKIKNIASKQIVDVLNKNENSIKKLISEEIEKYFEESIQEFLCRVRKEEKTVFEILSDERLCFCDVSISDVIVKIRKNLSEKIYLEIKNAQIEKILAIKVRDGIRDKVKQKLLMSIVVNEGLLNEFETGVVTAANAAGINFTAGMGFRLAGLIIGTAVTIIYILRYAGRIRKDPTKSLIYEDKERIEKKFDKHAEDLVMTLRFKIALILFLAAFVVMVYGVAIKGWWFEEMTVLFLVTSVIIGIVLRVSEKEFVSKFIEGAGGLIGVGLVIGIARAVNIILETGKVSDTILYKLSGIVSGMNPFLFIVIMMLIFVVLGFFINSSSGLATLSIPIIAPLADAVGMPREIIISAYIFGLGMISFITPTGLILATLDLVDVTYNKWIKFVLPLMGILTVLSMILLILQVAFSK